MSVANRLRRGAMLLWGLLVLLACSSTFGADRPKVLVASKPFTESYLLSEMVAQLIDAAGEAEAVRKFGLGGPQLVVEGLRSGVLDVEVDYSGSLSHLLLPDKKNVTEIELSAALRQAGLVASKSLGFNNTYALAVRKDMAAELRLRTVSDLRNHPALRAAFTPDFLNYEDGFFRLQKVYGIDMPNVRPMQHALAYAALEHHEIDLTDAYTTDGSLPQYQLTLLEDDRDFFPKYLGILVIRAELANRYPKTWQQLLRLEGRIPDHEMIRLNAEIDVKKRAIETVAQEFLTTQGLLSATLKNTQSQKLQSDGLGKATLEHLWLVLCSLLLSALIGIPLGIVAVQYQRTGQLLIAMTSLLQTIPSLALLCLLIPLLGIGARPTIFALFLYGLLPIAQSTTTGLLALDPRLVETAKILGLSRFTRLMQIELPLASRTILSGIKTTAVINVASATIAAMIGAGGYGRFITSGLAMNDMRTMLLGAIPTALMAVCFHFLFELLTFLLVPRGLQNVKSRSA